MNTARALVLGESYIDIGDRVCALVLGRFNLWGRELFWGVFSFEEKSVQEANNVKPNSRIILLSFSSARILFQPQNLYHFFGTHRLRK